MSAFGIIAGVLQLGVPSYAFRLVRRYGAQQVGWFVVAAFACLALLHLATPMHVFRLSVAPEMTMHAVLAAGSVLLVIGMGHLEALCSERVHSRRIEQQLRADAEQLWQGETQHLAKSRERLAEELALLQQREQALATSASQYESLFRLSPQPMCLVRRDSGQFLLLNESASRQFCLATDSAGAVSMLQYLAPDDAASFVAELAESSAAVSDFGARTLLLPDDRNVTMELSGIDLQFDDIPVRLLSFTDVTTREQCESERAQAEKLAAMTQVSGALGKAFSSVLAPIESTATALHARFKDTDPGALKQITTATARGIQLSRQLLAIGGCHPIELRPLDVNAFLRGLNPMLARLVGDRIILQNGFGSHVATVSGDSRLLEHLFVTLVLNARDAIPGKGTITVSTSAIRAELNPAGQIPAGELVRISVRDTGRGLTPEVRAHLFEPFVKSDAPDQLGLGLASCHGIVRQHGGWMECTSEEQRGTEFRIFLPCATVKENPTHETRTISKSDATILLVEPDDRLRATTRTALSWQGYRVIEADSASLALLLWENQSDQIDLLITPPPGCAGVSDLAAQLLETKPALRVVHLPGGETDPAAGGEPVRKPFTRERLLELVNRALG